MNNGEAVPKPPVRGVLLTDQRGLPLENQPPRLTSDSIVAAEIFAKLDGVFTRGAVEAPTDQPK